MSVLERRRARKWEQGDGRYSVEFSGVFSTQTQSCFPGGMASGDPVFTEAVIDPQVKPHTGFDYEWPHFGRIEFPLVGFGPCGYGNGSGPETNFALSQTSSCPPAVAAAAPAEKRSGSVASEKMSSAARRESFKKRKADSFNTKTVAGDEPKKTKGCGAKGDSNKTEENTNHSSKRINNKTEISTDASKESSKVSKAQKPDYIHVRARRGQATDSHSLAERVRREKISERMKFLQDLVPGCSKITGKAGMLDEIISYVQSLQQQVEFLSMKLAAVNSRIDLDTENFLAKEMFPPSSASFQRFEMSPDITNPAYPQFNQVQQAVSRCEVEIGGIRPPGMGIGRTISAPISVPDAFLGPSCFAQIQASATWDVELQNLYNVVYDQGRSTPSPSLAFTGLVEASNPKMEM